ncbi:XdhC family protein [Chitinophaga barathri]|uniref:XdhC/CoxI family protein n=1 Tax=Chitinophaga barathri TaxID=1647451 RepID=A0A3N4MDV0_9BACT|nr:XdhC/CoxI family protein [Chitinophaga barathri]RPD39787.1 XdhC/CoxI family protein [Chitinophaga barathri]
MKEILEIIQAYETARRDQMRAVLATVVKVEGSSYRQPGARMLVTEDGSLTGAISGGCLEGDALRKALLAIHQRQNKLITYDTSNPDDIEFGVQLGCNGIVHILFEYIDTEKPDNALALLSRLMEDRREAALVTCYSPDRKAPQQGTVLCWKAGAGYGAGISGVDLSADLAKVIEERRTIIRKISTEGDGVEVLLEYVAPRVSLIVAGAGNDVKPLVIAASLLGWEVTVADGRVTHAKAARFPGAKNVLPVRPEELISRLAIDKSTVFVLMTHNYKYDLALLKALPSSPTPYIGVLGPKTKLNRMLQDLASEGINLTSEQLDRVYGPVGLDIGAETPEEIAISIIAEIKAVLGGKTAGFLKFRNEKIHKDTIVLP